jgi:hypothetical protein
LTRAFTLLLVTCSHPHVCTDPKLTGLFVDTLKEVGEEDLLLFLIEVDAFRFSSSEHAERQFYPIARKYLASETGTIISQLVRDVWNFKLSP